MIRLRTSGTQQCEYSADCKRPALFIRTEEPPTSTKKAGIYCDIHAHDIIANDPHQMAELIIDTVRMKEPE